jgi:hypothetical protein
MEWKSNLSFGTLNVRNLYVWVSTEYIYTMKWNGHVARMGENNLLGDLGRKISVKMNLDQRVRILAGLDCLSMASSDKHF